MNPNLIAIILTIVLGIYFLIKLKRNFSQKLFFKIGMWLFLIQAVSSVYGIILEYSYLNLAMIIGRLASVCFNLLLAYVFYFMLKNTPEGSTNNGVQLSEEEINKYLEGNEEAKLKHFGKELI